MKSSACNSPVAMSKRSTTLRPAVPFQVTTTCFWSSDSSTIQLPARPLLGSGLLNEFCHAFKNRSVSSGLKNVVRQTCRAALVCALRKHCLVSFAQD